MSFLARGLLCAGLCAASSIASSVASDPAATELARSVLLALGGQEAWDGTRYVRWEFFGQRTHYWDRFSGDVRIEEPRREDLQGNDTPELLVLMNVRTLEGRVWSDGELVQDPGLRAALLRRAHEWWVNDSYWMFMPYKLLDPGVRLKHLGRREMADGRAADVLELTFDDGVGYPPGARYDVYVAVDSGYVEQWAFYADAADPEPRFVLPWAGWKRFGKIRLATRRVGDDREDSDWGIAVPDELPRTVFESPEPVAR